MEKNNNKYGYPTTSLTMVEKLARGEDWERFYVRYYEPIKRMFLSVNNGQVAGADVEDALSEIFVKLKQKLQTSYDLEKGKKGKLRNWLSTIVRNAIHDYCKRRKKQQAPLLSNQEDGSNPLANVPAPQPTADDQEWVEFLQHSSLVLAETCRPWSSRDREIHKAIRESYLAREESARHTDSEIAKSFGITEVNFRQIRSRYFKEVRKQYNEFRNDDPTFFKIVEKAGTSFDALLDKYLQTMGGGEAVVFKKRQGFA